MALGVAILMMMIYIWFRFEWQFGLGAMMGLSNDWMYNVIKQVGNYGESFERTVGMGSTLKLERGQNQLWTKGGLLYAPPAR
jgi:general L-amino acid transport system substrate-binding protein